MNITVRELTKVAYEILTPMLDKYFNDRFGAKAGTWYDIKTAPKNGTQILVTDGDHIDMAYWDYGTWCAPHSTSNDIPQTPTLWQPKPEPPKTNSPETTEAD